MRVRIANARLSATDAVGESMLDQGRFFASKGNGVHFVIDAPASNGAEKDATVSIVPPGISPQGVAGRYLANADLCIFHYAALYPLLEAIPFVNHGSIVLCYHNVTPPVMWSGEGFAREHLLRTVHRTGEFAAVADLVVTPSEYNAGELVNEHGVERAKIRVVPFAIDPAVFHPGPRNAALAARYGLAERTVIMFAGRMAGNKRIELLVEALALVKPRIPQAALLLVGDQSAPALKPSVERVHARVNELGLQRDVVFAGMVEDLAAHYRLADVYATASVHEGFGVPLLEAMASGVPVVASRATAHPEVVGDAGVLCEPDSAEAIAEAILGVLESSDVRAELASLGLARGAGYTRARHDAHWEQIVAEVADMNRAGSLRRNRLWALGGSTTASGNSAAMTEWQRAIEADLQRLDALADVMLRDYRVQSHVPVIGRLIAWLRANSTSHLREPYLDPTLERQVIFNRQIMLTLVRILRGIPVLAAAAHSDVETIMPAGEPASPAASGLDIESRLANIEARLDRIMQLVDERTSASNNAVSESGSRRT